MIITYYLNTIYISMTYLNQMLFIIAYNSLSEISYCGHPWYKL